MPTWITHLIIADNVINEIPELDKQCFCVGSIAPDCNVENEDWTQFVPSKKVTHWMSSDSKTPTDCDRFYKEYIENRKDQIPTNQELSFLLGYYAHLVADSEFQKYAGDENRIAKAWERINQHPKLAQKASKMPPNWNSIKTLVGKEELKKDRYTIEAEYLEENPNTGYITEILNLKSFPDYIDYLPKGAIVRKIGIMGYMPKKETGTYPFMAMTREEFATYIDITTKKIITKIKHK